MENNCSNCNEPDCRCYFVVTCEVCKFHTKSLPNRNEAEDIQRMHNNFSGHHAKVKAFR